MENFEQFFFMIKLSLTWEYYDTYHENLHYKSFPLPLTIVSITKRTVSKVADPNSLPW